MDISANWKGLFELLNDLILQENAADLEEALLSNIDHLIPADKGAPLFSYETKPVCQRWPDYSASKIPQFNSYYNEKCPVPFNRSAMMVGPVKWRHYSNSEYDTDFNRPLGIGHTLGFGFCNFESRNLTIIAVNRSRRAPPFSKRDIRDFKLLTNLFSILYNQRIHHASEINRTISLVCQRFGNTPLSCREMEVCALLHKGLTSREIAQRLHISPRTVERHTAHIYQKMNIADRKELMSLINSAVQRPDIP